MYGRIIFNIILIIFLTALQLAFINNLPGALSGLNLILIFLLFILILGNLEIALWWAVGAGIILDIFSFSIFGFFLITFCLMIFAANFLLVNFFTNRSLYSFCILATIVIFFYEFILNFIRYLTSFLGGSSFALILNFAFWKTKASELILNLLLVFILFYLVNFITNSLKPVFLIKGE
jgi:rod shape-determining protein MreD